MKLTDTRGMFKEKREILEENMYVLTGGFKGTPVHICRSIDASDENAPITVHLLCEAKSFKSTSSGWTDSLTRGTLDAVECDVCRYVAPRPVERHVGKR